MIDVASRPAVAQNGRLDTWLKTADSNHGAGVAEATHAFPAAIPSLLTSQRPLPIDLTVDNDETLADLADSAAKAPSVAARQAAAEHASAKQAGVPSTASPQAPPRKNAFEALMSSSQVTPKKAARSFKDDTSAAAGDGSNSRSAGASITSMFDWERKASGPWFTTFCRWAANPCLIEQDEPGLYVRSQSGAAHEPCVPHDNLHCRSAMS